MGGTSRRRSSRSRGEVRPLSAVRPYIGRDGYEIHFHTLMVATMGDDPQVLLAGEESA